MTLLGQIMVAGRDEDLRARDLVAAVRLRLGLGAQQAEIGAAMRFGEAHRARPFATDHLGQIGLLEFVRGVALDRGGRAVGEARIEAERHVGRADHLLDQLVDRLGQTLPAPFGIGSERRPATFAELVVSLLEALGRAHHAILVGATLQIARGVDRQQHVLGDLVGLLQHGVEQIGGELLELFQAAEAIVGEQFVEHEAHVPQRRVIDLHRLYPLSEPVRTELVEVPSFSKERTRLRLRSARTGNILSCAAACRW